MEELDQSQGLLSDEMQGFCQWTCSLCAAGFFGLVISLWPQLPWSAADLLSGAATMCWVCCMCLSVQGVREILLERMLACQQVPADTNMQSSSKHDMRVRWTLLHQALHKAGEHCLFCNRVAAASYINAADACWLQPDAYPDSTMMFNKLQARALLEACETTATAASDSGEHTLSESSSTTHFCLRLPACLPAL